MKGLLLFLFLGLSLLGAKDYSFKEIEAMPSSYAKDYYTWRFISEKKTSKEESLKAYTWTKRKSYKLKKAIHKKLGYTPTTPKKNAKVKDPKNYIIYPGTAAKKSLKELKKLHKKIKHQGKYSDTLEVMASNEPFVALTKQKASTQCYIFNAVGSKYRKKYFNESFSPKQLEHLIHEAQFNQSIAKIVTTHALQKTKKSLVFMIDENNLSFQSNFFLAVNAVEFNQIEVAKNFLKIARTKTTYQSKFDQVDFWFYLLTKDEKYLDKLIKSYDVNVYTLRARDILKVPYPKVESPKLAFKSLPDFDVTNPIDWEKIKLEMKEDKVNLATLSQKYDSSETLGIYTYIKERETKYQIPYYPMPYPLSMWGLEKERIALLYAIARQESRFIPASVSPSYALGMMQIMPFLIKHLAKERQQEIDLNEMFNPYLAVNYANQHLNYLNKWLYNPLLVAYAYNGGIGFTKRTVRSSHMFKKGKYEPFLSMELIDYPEAREYGKKVLTNYVIYLNLLGIETKVSPLLNSLEYPSQSDRFRK
ncbi:MAG: Soluble lytic murein transglycosylase precursor (EC [uncultured Sulfurovum sp.]|uniref:Soluble lytic murein transglycosylase (EC) n=1 Tax=uncultured Sulfurovum sp. TaxID=269237 RepID=A0A6S6TLY6_9BACT|nr:MAG: Soluble lytic murein transglycosylase precursor (EC [uncultured Sulfurovum sp.]